MADLAPDEAHTAHTLVAADQRELIGAAEPSAERVQLTRVFQGPGATIIRIAFAPGQEMREHSTNSPIIVQVLSGVIRFSVSGETLAMPAGAVVHVEASVPHSLVAEGEAHVLLTLCTAPAPIASPTLRAGARRP